MYDVIHFARGRRELATVRWLDVVVAWIAIGLIACCFPRSCLLFGELVDYAKSLLLRSSTVSKFWASGISRPVPDT